MLRVKLHWKELLLLLLTVVVLIVGMTPMLALQDTFPLVAAFIAGSVAFSVQGSIAQRHEREDTLRLRQHREDDYELVIEHLIASFTGGKLDVEREAKVRRQVVLWGSKDFMERYADWRQAISRYSGRGSVPISPEDKADLQEALGRVCVAARQDLKIETRDNPTSHDIARIASILFDDYKADSLPVEEDA